MKKLSFAITLFISILHLQVAAQPGSLDTSFGTNGVATTDVNSENDIANSVAIQNDGKIVVAGSARNSSNQDFAIARYNVDGSPDLSFGTSGKIITDFTDDNEIAYDVIIQPDGKILVAGTSGYLPNGDFALARYYADGSPDPEFGNDGKVKTDLNGGNDQARAMVLLPNGHILVGGYSFTGTKNEFVVVKYYFDGYVDTSFGTNGIKTIAFGNYDDVGMTLGVQPDGKILIAGRSLSSQNQDFAIARLLPDGDLDTSFGIGGKVTTDIGTHNDQINALAIQNNGKIVVGGFATLFDTGSYDFAIARYNTDGSLDTNFGDGGKVKTDFYQNNDVIEGLAIQQNGKILAAGFSVNGLFNEFALARFNTDGAIDTGFGTDGKVTSDLFPKDDGGTSIAIQPDNAIIVAGYTDNGLNFDFAVTRYKPGKLMAVYNGFTTATSISIYPNPVQKQAMLKFSLEKDQAVGISLFDIQGNLISQLSESADLKAGQQTKTINLPEYLPSGTYIVVISTALENIPYKIFKI